MVTPFPITQILFRYLDSILPDEYGVRETPLFFLSRNYWGFNQANQDVDIATAIRNVQKEYKLKSHASLKGKGIERGGPPESIRETNPTIDTEVSALTASALDPDVSTAVRIVHLRKVFKHGLVAVDDSSFVMQDGELLAILGANGSGKSTTCHMLSGVIPPTAGDAFINDKSSLFESHQRDGQGLIGWCPQHDILFDQLTPLEHVHPHHVYVTVDFVIFRHSRCTESRSPYSCRREIAKSSTMESQGKSCRDIFWWYETTTESCIVDYWESEIADFG